MEVLGSVEEPVAEGVAATRRIVGTGVGCVGVSMGEEGGTSLMKICNVNEYRKTR